MINIFRTLWQAAPYIDLDSLINIPDTFIFEDDQIQWYFKSRKTNQILKRKKENSSFEDVKNYFTKQISKFSQSNDIPAASLTYIDNVQQQMILRHLNLSEVCEFLVNTIKKEQKDNSQHILDEDKCQDNQDKVSFFNLDKKQMKQLQIFMQDSTQLPTKKNSIKLNENDYQCNKQSNDDQSNNDIDINKQNQYTTNNHCYSVLWTPHYTLIEKRMNQFVPSNALDDDYYKYLVTYEASESIAPSLQVSENLGQELRQACISIAKALMSVYRERGLLKKLSLHFKRVQDKFYLLNCNIIQFEQDIALTKHLDASKDLQIVSYSYKVVIPQDIMFKSSFQNQSEGNGVVNDKVFEKISCQCCGCQTDSEKAKNVTKNKILKIRIRGEIEHPRRSSNLGNNLNQQQSQRQIKGTRSNSTISTNSIQKQNTIQVQDYQSFISSNYNQNDDINKKELEEEQNLQQQLLDQEQQAIVQQKRIINDYNFTKVCLKCYKIYCKIINDESKIEKAIIQQKNHEQLLAQSKSVKPDRLLHLYNNTNNSGEKLSALMRCASQKRPDQYRLNTDNQDDQVNQLCPNSFEKLINHPIKKSMEIQQNDIINHKRKPLLPPSTNETHNIRLEKRNSQLIHPVSQNISFEGLSPEIKNKNNVINFCKRSSSVRASSQWGRNDKTSETSCEWQDKQEYYKLKTELLNEISTDYSQIQSRIETSLNETQQILYQKHNQSKQYQKVRKPVQVFDQQINNNMRQQINIPRPINKNQQNNNLQQQKFNDKVIDESNLIVQEENKFLKNNFRQKYLNFKQNDGVHKHPYLDYKTRDNLMQRKLRSQSVQKHIEYQQ